MIDWGFFYVGVFNLSYSLEGKGTASLFGAIRTETIMKLLEFPKVDTPSESMLSLATSDVIHRLFRLFNEIPLTTVFFI